MTEGGKGVPFSSLEVQAASLHERFLLEFPSFVNSRFGSGFGVSFFSYSCLNTARGGSPRILKVLSNPTATAKPTVAMRPQPSTRG